MTVHRTFAPLPGTCSDCKRKRDVFPISRQGGGAYNRAPRTYSSSICGECCMYMLAGAHRDTEPRAMRAGYDVGTIMDICRFVIEKDGDREVTVRVQVADPEATYGFRHVEESRSGASLVAVYDEAVAARRASCKADRATRLDSAYALGLR